MALPYGQRLECRAGIISFLEVVDPKGRPMLESLGIPVSSSQDWPDQAVPLEM